MNIIAVRTSCPDHCCVKEETFFNEISKVLVESVVAHVSERHHVTHRNATMVSCIIENPDG